MTSTSKSLAALAVAVLLAAGLLLLFSQLGSEEPRPVETPGNPLAGGKTGREVVPLVDPVPRVEEPAGASSSTRATTTREVTCRSALDGARLAGIRAYTGTEAIAGPTDEKGVLTFENAPLGLVTFWGPGSVPREIDAAALGDEVRLEAASGSLDVRLEGMEATDRVVRTLLEPRTRHARAGGPWRSELVQVTEAYYRASSLVAGEVDVYVWVSRDGGEVFPVTQARVAILAGENTALTLSLDDLVTWEEDQ